MLEELEVTNDRKWPFFSPKSSGFRSILLEFPRLPTQFSKVGGEVYTNGNFLDFNFFTKSTDYVWSSNMCFNFGFG